MRSALHPLLCVLALWAAPAPPLSSAPSERLITSLRAQLLEEPDGKARQDLLSALDSLEAGATSAQPQQRQAWIDSHLGELNAAVRTLGADAPARTARKAARQAAALNNRAERWEEARAFAEQALSFDPEDHDALISRSQANSRLGEYARAFADADRVARVAPDAAAAYTARACASYGLGNYLQAIEDARKALALDPEDKTAFSIMKLSEGRTRAVPPSEQGRTRLADSVEREYHGMIQQLNEVEERRLTPVESPSARGVQRLTSSASSKLSVKDYGGAIEEADKALALDPADPQALYYRAVAHNLIGEYGSAARDATRGLIAAPSDWAMRDARAWAYNHMGRIREAIADSQHALELNPRDAYAFANRAFANEQRGDFTAMAEDYKAAAELSPQFEPAYRDSARRHGLDPKPIARERGAARFVDLIPARVRSFMVVLFASLLGGLLIALGVLHVVTGIKEREANAAPPVPATGLEAGYEIGKAIGQGGMGVVYEAVDRKLRRPVAVKMLRGEFQLDETAKVRFIEEARTVAELRHPAIVDIHAIIEDERGVSLVFERLEGRTLDEILAERRRLPLSEVKDILEPVCSGLSYAHAHDVVHRDLKPSNIMILKGGGVKLLDFGISRHAARAGGAATQTVTGTPHYMAPEQEYGSVRKENDVFSLGAVLYEMVTGARPYEGSCQTKLAKAYTLASHRAPDVSLALDALIDRALEPDADKRIPSPAEFWKQLNAVPEAPEPARAVYPAYAR